MAEGSPASPPYLPGMEPAPVDLSGTTGDFIAFGLFIGLLVGVLAWSFHTGGRNARAAALTPFGRAVGSTLCAIGLAGYLAAAAVVGIGGYGAWSTWRAERAEIAVESR